MQTDKKARVTAIKRHRRVYRVVWRLATWYVKRKYHFTPEPCPTELKAPYLVLSNHNLDMDAVLVAASFPQHMYFVASEHIYRRGFISKLLAFFFAPIARKKGGTDATTAMTILRALRSGCNVCLFAEGNRSFNGRTCELHPSTWKLIRGCRCTVVTYHMTGGYLTSPRWSISPRKGKMTGQVRSIYSAAQIAAMTDDMLEKTITAELYENAYERQETEPTEFIGKNPAMLLEKALYLCPVCGGVETLSSCGDLFRCTCGLRLQYDSYGYFKGENVPFRTVLQWDMWQEACVEAMARNVQNLAVQEVAAACDVEKLDLAQPLYQDSLRELVELTGAHRESLTDRGSMALYNDRMIIGNTVFPIQDISDMALYGRDAIVFTANNRHYEVRCTSGGSGRKYVTMYHYLRENRI